MQMSYHGGGCCGMRHIKGFVKPTQPNVIWEEGRPRDDIDKATGRQFTVEEAFERCFEKLEKELYYEDYGSKCVEVVLTDLQLSTSRGGGIWLTKLKERGFKLVNRFQNTTGAYCNVFHYAPSKSTKIPEFLKEFM